MNVLFPLGRFILNRNSGVIHTLDCRYVKMMAEKNICVCKSVAEAESLYPGARLCKVCSQSSPSMDDAA